MTLLALAAVCGCNFGGVESTATSPAAKREIDDPGKTKSNNLGAAHFTSTIFINDDANDLILPSAVAATLRRMISEPPIDFDLDFLEKSLPVGTIEFDGSQYELHFELLVSGGQPRKVWSDDRIARLSHRLTPESTRDDILKAFAEFAREDANGQPQDNPRDLNENDLRKAGIWPAE